MQDRITTRRTVLSALGISLVGGLAGTAGAEDEKGKDDADDDRKDHDDHDEKELPKEFSARLSGEEQVPPVETNAYGKATFRVSEDGSEVHFSVYLDCIRNVTQAHVHLGRKGENGPVVAWLYPKATREPELVDGFFEGTLAEGTLTKDDLVGDLKGESLETLAKRVLDRGAYVNVHTEQNPDGEVRGQIEAEGDVSERSEEAEGEEHEGDQEPEEEPSRSDTDETVSTADEARGALEVSEINVLGDDPEDESIVLTNTSDLYIDMSGWSVRDADGGVVDGLGLDPVTFPPGFVLGPNRSVTIETASGTDTDDTVHWGYDRQNWNQEGDTIIVQDADGNVALEHTYGDRTASLVGFFMNLV